MQTSHTTLRLLLVATVALLADAAGIAQGTFVMPSSFADQMAGGGGDPITPGRSADYIPYRHQFVFGAYDMAMPFGVYYITGMSFRLVSIGGVGAGNSLDAVTPDIEFRMSTTSRRVDGLFGSFASNTGPDEVAVIPRGPLRVTGTIIPGQAVQPFSVHFDFTTPFLYSRGWGNLLLDIINYQGSPIRAEFDGTHDFRDDSVSQVSYNGLTQGVVFSSGLATEFHYTQLGIQRKQPE